MAAFDQIVSGLQEAVAHAKGEHVPGMIIHEPTSSMVSRIRAATGLSQVRFAQSIGVPVGTLRQWETGRRSPTGPARVLLALIERDPCIVERYLGDSESAT